MSLAYIKVREKGKKAFWFMASKGTVSRLRIHAAQFREPDKAVEEFRKDNPNHEFKIVPVAKPATKKVTAITYYTWAHNVEMCLQNGSFVRVHPDGRIAQYMNGDYMGNIGKIPKGMKQIDTSLAMKLLPECCS